MSYTITNIRKESIPISAHHAKRHLHYDVKDKDGSVVHVVRLLNPSIKPNHKNTQRFEPLSNRALQILTARAQYSEAVDRKTAKPHQGIEYCKLISSKVTTAAKPVVATPAKPKVAAPAKPIIVPPAKPKVAVPAKPVVVPPVKSVAPTLTPQQVAASIKLLDDQIKKLDSKIIELNTQLASERKDKAKLISELEKTRKDNETIKGALQILLNREHD